MWSPFFFFRTVTPPVIAGRIDKRSRFNVTILLAGPTLYVGWAFF